MLRVLRASVAVAFLDFQPFFYVKEDLSSCVLARAVRTWKFDIVLRPPVSGIPRTLSVSREEYTTIGFFWDRPPENAPF